MTLGTLRRLIRGAARWQTAALTLPLVLASVSPASAGPPFLTDDPEPVDYQHFEFYTFSTRDKAADGGTATLGPAFEYNVGALPNLQVHLVVPYAWSGSPGIPGTSGLGDTEVGVKYRFVQQTKAAPEIGIFPMAELATGNANDGLGNGRTWFRLPVWIQKNIGAWTTYGGGGVALNASPGMKNYAFGGWLVQRDFGERWTLGGEIFANGGQTVDGTQSTFYNVGGYFKPSDRFNVLFSVGHTVSGAGHAIAYFGLYWTGGPASRGDEPALRDANLP